MADKITGLTIEIAADTTKFLKGIKDVDREVGRATSSIANMTKALKLEWDNEKFINANKRIQEAMQKTDKSITSLKEKLTKWDNAGIDRTNENYQKLEQALTKAEYQAVRLKDQLKQLEQIKIDKVVRDVEKLGEGFTKAGKALAPLSAAAVGLLATLTKMTTSTMSFAKEITHLANRLNVSTDFMQKWQYIAMQSGLSNEELTNSFSRVNIAIGRLAEGIGSTNKLALERLGFTAEDMLGSYEEVINKIINRLVALDDANMRTAISADLFGTLLAGKINPILSKSGEALNELGEEFDSLGTLTNNQVKDLLALKLHLDKVLLAIKSVGRQIAYSMIPLIEAVTAFVETKVLPAFQKLREMFKGLDLEQLKLIGGILLVTAAISPMLLLIGKLTMGLGGAIKTALNLNKAFTALNANPIMATVGLLAVLFTLLYAKNEAFRNSINKLVGALANSLGPILDLVVDIFKDLMEVLDPVIDALGDVLADVLNTVAEALAPIIKTIVGTLAPFIKLASRELSFLVKIIYSLMPVIKKINDFFFDFLRVVTETIQWIASGVEWLVNKIIDGINIMIRGLNHVSSLIGVTMREIDHVDFNINKKISGDVKVEQPDDVKIDDKNWDFLGDSWAGTTNNITNNDYSNKDINVTVVVENYAEKVDVEDLVKQINLEMAKSM